VDKIHYFDKTRELSYTHIHMLQTVTAQSFQKSWRKLKISDARRMVKTTNNTQHCTKFTRPGNLARRIWAFCFKKLCSLKRLLTRMTLVTVPVTESPRTLQWISFCEWNRKIHARYVTKFLCEKQPQTQNPVSDKASIRIYDEDRRSLKCGNRVMKKLKTTLVLHISPFRYELLNASTNSIS
jgi:hypothetical protein